MATSHALLGLLEREPRHGYELKRQFDELFPSPRPLPYGQIYATLARLLRDGRIDVAAVESGAGPDRKLYVITPDGIDDLERWITSPAPPPSFSRTELFTKTVVAFTSGRDPQAVLDEQRAAHLVRMRELTERRRTADLIGALACDHELFHLEADVRWIERAAKRFEEAGGSR
jgi:DNA-binding PadR family transcriptional regulator